MIASVGTRLVAATTRTSTWISDLPPPTRRKLPSWSTRSSLACVLESISAISSRNSVPPSASSKQPSRRSVDRKSTRLNSSHSQISYAVFCLKKKKKPEPTAHLQINGVLPPAVTSPPPSCARPKVRCPVAPREPTRTYRNARALVGSRTNLYH